MSIGNYAGGRLADRYRPARLLPWLFLLSAGGCLLCLFLNYLFAEQAPLRSLDWPPRIFLTVLAIFTLPALLLGTITPVTAKMAVERNPQIGILQTLVTGMPTRSAFARIFQFGMRLGMRSYTLGSAWWQGDCGPYWGHNAVLRLAPFIEHCHLPLLPGRPPLGGHILSHDQVEAVLMRRAGYEVRVLPEEGDSFEQNPPTLLEFIRRDLRWCQGNMQYWRLLALRGLRPMSRIQLALAIQMYLGSPAWMGFLLLGVARATLPFLPPMHFDPEIGPAMFLVVLFMTFAPKIATAVDVFLRSGLRRGFGGGLRFAANLVSEILFSALLAPVVALGNTIFMTGLLFGRTIGWTAQRRDDHAVSLVDAARRLWPQSVLGVLLGIIAWRGGYFLISLPMTLGFAIAIPFAIATSLPGLGRAFILLGLGRIPEETHAPPILLGLGLPALAGRSPPAPARKTALDAAD
jgi:membrane glycosyltransferase